ncbi:MAG: Flp family type IVb pilin [Hyphomonas sp.]
MADEAGATAIEYGLIAALIIVVLLAGLIQVADANNENYELIEATITA